MGLTSYPKRYLDVSVISDWQRASEVVPCWCLVCQVVTGSIPPLVGDVKPTMAAATRQSTEGIASVAQLWLAVVDRRCVGVVLVSDQQRNAARQRVAGKVGLDCRLSDYCSKRFVKMDMDVNVCIRTNSCAR